MDVTPAAFDEPHAIVKVGFWTSVVTGHNVSVSRLGLSTDQCPCAVDHAIAGFELVAAVCLVAAHTSKAPRGEPCGVGVSASDYTAIHTHV